MTKTMSSRKQATRWAVGIVIMNAKTSSMKVLKACIENNETTQSTKLSNECQTIIEH